MMIDKREWERGEVKSDKVEYCGDLHDINQSSDQSAFGRYFCAIWETESVLFFSVNFLPITIAKYLNWSKSKQNVSPTYSDHVSDCNSGE